MCSVANARFTENDPTTNAVYNELYYKVISGTEFFMDETDLELALGELTYRLSNIEPTLCLCYQVGHSLYQDFLNQMHRMDVLYYFRAHLRCY